MSLDLLIRLNDGTGNIVKMTHAEEVYTAYETGRQLALAAQDTQGSLSNSPLYATIVGTFENSYLLGAVGTHGVVNTTEAKPTQYLYQKNLYNVDLGNANFYRPALLKGADDTLHFADDTEMNTVVDRMLHVIFTNDYPGTYKLATSSPGADYTNFLSNIFTDTRTDGTNVSYNIYKRLTMTPPGDSSHKPMRRKNSSGAIQKMTDAEMRVSFGEWAKKRIIDGGIGKVQLRTSAQGVPTDPGTWKAIGTATDTRQDIITNQNYTRTSNRTRSSTFEGNYQFNYTRGRLSTYAGDYGFNFARNRLSTYTRGSATDYTRNSTRDSVNGFLGNYVGDFTGNYAFNFTRDSSVEYTRVSTVYFEGNYGFNFVGNYEFNFQGNYEQNYTRISGRARASTFSTFYLGYAGTAFSNNFLAFFEGNYAFNFTREVNTQYTRGRLENFTRQIPAPYLGNYTFDFTGNYANNYTRNSTRDSTRARVSTYTGDYGGNYTFNFTGNYGFNFTGNYGTNFVGNYGFNFLGNYAFNYTRNRGSTYLGNYTGDFIADEVAATSSTIETYTLYVRTL